MSNVDKIHEYMLGMYSMYSWITIGLMFVVLVTMLAIVSPQVEGFTSQNANWLLAQRQQLQFEGEGRYNELGRVENPNSNPSATGIDDAVRLLIPKATNQTSNQMMNVISSGNLKATPYNENISLEETGNVQAKINFCESLTTVNCDYSDPRMAECGFCHTKGVNSKGAPWRGGMYISADDQHRANQAAIAANPSGNQYGPSAQYVPTVGTCDPKNFTLVQGNCQARENQLICEKSPGLDGSPCAQCYGSNGPLLYVGPKPRSYQAYLNVSHPGGNYVAGWSNMIVTVYHSNNTSTDISIPSSPQMILDYKRYPITLIEGETITITTWGMPAVWCAWFSSLDEKRNVGIDIGVSQVTPQNGISIIGDKRSLRVARAFRAENGFSEFKAKVPNSIMWFGRNSAIPGIVKEAWYGIDKQNGVSVMQKVCSVIRYKQSYPNGIPVSPEFFGVSEPALELTETGEPAPRITKYLWIKLDNDVEYLAADGESIDINKLYNHVKITMKVPATLVDPTYAEDLQACPSGPMIGTGVGAGLFGSNSCYNANGTFNASLSCLQELFRGAGGNENGSMWPYSTDAAKSIIQKVNGVPDLDATVSFLGNLGSIANYSTDSAGASVDFPTYVDASMKMLGTKPKNMCDGPNKETGPHTPECLDYLWRTNGSTTASPDSSYSYCSRTGTRAPLNSDGSPNADNIARANNRGSIASIGAYYSGIYTDAQNTGDFDKWSVAMKKCYNTNVTAPKIDCPVPPPPPYDNGKVYRTGDKVSFSGGYYRLSAYIGGAGYSPSHPSSEGKKWIQYGSPYDEKTKMCITAVEQTGFIPRITWGTTPGPNQQAICDDLLCPYFKNKYGSLNNVPSKYAAEVNYCISRGLGVAESPQYDAKTQTCITAVEQTGFIPLVTWGTTPGEFRDAICDKLLCPYFKNKYGSLDNVPAIYKPEANYCKSQNLGV